MAHQRKLIRHAAVAQLTGATAAGARVVGTRTEPHKKSQLPALSVYTLHDPVKEDSSSTTEDVHELQLEIVGWVALPSTPGADDGDAIDDLAEQIETAMITDPTLGGAAANARLVGTEIEVREENGASDPRVGIVTLTYEVEYQKSLAPEQALVDFLRAKATYQLVGGIEDDTPPAEDQFSVRP